MALYVIFDVVMFYVDVKLVLWPMDESFATVRFVVFVAVEFSVEFIAVFVLFGGRFELGITIGMSCVLFKLTNFTIAPS